MNERVLRCFVRGRGSRWEAMCLDLDIVVEGISRQDAASRLEQAIFTYVDSALAEPPRQAERLLRRRAPWRVRVRVVLSSLLHVVRRSRADRDLRANFEVACPA